MTAATPLSYRPIRTKFPMEYCRLFLRLVAAFSISLSACADVTRPAFSAFDVLSGRTANTQHNAGASVQTEKERDAQYCQQLADQFDALLARDEVVKAQSLWLRLYNANCPEKEATKRRLVNHRSSFERAAQANRSIGIQDWLARARDGEYWPHGVVIVGQITQQLEDVIFVDVSLQEGSGTLVAVEVDRQRLVTPDRRANFILTRFIEIRTYTDVFGVPKRIPVFRPLPIGES